MMESLRSATRNTGFERWLDATLRPPPQADAPTPPGSSPKADTPALQGDSPKVLRLCSPCSLNASLPLQPCSKSVCTMMT